MFEFGAKHLDEKTFLDQLGVIALVD